MYCLLYTRRVICTSYLGGSRFIGALIFSIIAAVACLSQQGQKEPGYRLAMQEYAGNYETDHQRIFVISLSSSGTLAYIDVSTDISDLISESRKDGFQTEDKLTTLSFVRDHHGAIQGLQFADGNTPGVYARKVLTTEREVFVHSEKAEIRGILIIPPSQRKVAALIIEGGSGWRFAEEMANYARLAASHGFASFVWDRRGWGEIDGPKGGLLRRPGGGCCGNRNGIAGEFQD